MLKRIDSKILLLLLLMGIITLTRNIQLVESKADISSSEDNSPIKQDVLPHLYLDPTTTVGPPPDIGEILTLTLRVSDVVDLVQFAVDIEWDPTKLEYVKWVEGACLKSNDPGKTTWCLVASIVPGKITDLSCVIHGFQPPDGVEVPPKPDDLACFEFKVLNYTCCTGTWINMTMHELYDDHLEYIPHTATNACMHARVRVGIHDLRTILLDAPVNKVYFLYADPAYMTRPEASYDFASGGMIYGLCGNPQHQGFNTTKHWLVDTGAINATTISNATIVMFGGPYPHVAVRYYEDSHVGFQDGNWLAPVRFAENASHYWFENQTYAIVGMLPISAVRNGHEDMFVIDVFSHGDNTVLIIYGFDWKGTWAAGIYFKEVMLENLSNYEKQYYIFHWVDDSDQDSIPQSSEIVMASSG